MLLTQKEYDPEYRTNHPKKEKMGWERRVNPDNFSSSSVAKINPRNLQFLNKYVHVTNLCVYINFRNPYPYALKSHL